MESCDECNPEAEIPFDWVLRAFADARDYVDYILQAGLFLSQEAAGSSPVGPVEVLSLGDAPCFFRR